MRNKILVVAALGLASAALASSSSAAGLSLSDASETAELGRLQRPSFSLEGSAGGVAMNFTLTIPEASLGARTAAPVVLGSARPEAPEASTGGSYLVEWKAPVWAAAEGWTYEIQRRSGQDPFVTVAWTEDGSYREQGLEDGVYSYRVRAVGPDGAAGPYSRRSAQVRVSADAPSLALNEDSSRKFDTFDWTLSCAPESSYCAWETSAYWDVKADEEEYETYDDEYYDYLVRIISNSRPWQGPLFLDAAPLLAWSPAKQRETWISTEKINVLIDSKAALRSNAREGLDGSAEALVPGTLRTSIHDRAPPASLPAIKTTSNLNKSNKNNNNLEKVRGTA